MTYQEILQRMLDQVPDAVDKREGSIIYNALAPAAIEMQLMYIEAGAILNETFADTASRIYLIKRAAERGVVPDEASKAILKGEFNIDVPISSRFSLDALNYKAIEKISTGVFKLECETEGAEGNLHLGTLIPIDYIDGLTSAGLTGVLIPGEDEEETESLRSKYFATLQSQAYGGNIADYKEKTNAIQGVGGVKVYPTWSGGGTVKLVILDSTLQHPSTELVNTVQTAIDPIGNQGTGAGLAPIGHVVTVVGVNEQTIDITTNITYQTDWTWDDVKSYVEAAIDEYFLELNQTWEENENLVVRISQIETRLLNVIGIIDISETTINGAEANLILDADSIPVRGDIVG